MKNAFFIADIHLSAQNERRKQLFVSFCEMVRKTASNLYILGDLFDFWANNARVRADFRDVFLSLKNIRDAGSTPSFLFGNRDFLLTADTLNCYGIDFLGEEAEIILANERVYLTHGHALCTDDVEFIQYKKRMWPLFRLLDRVLPGIIENYIARRFIIKSKAVISAQDKKRLSFTDEAIEEVLSRGIDSIICGHCHQHMFKNYAEGRFFALGDWSDTEGPFLVFENNSFHYRTWTGSDQYR